MLSIGCSFQRSFATIAFYGPDNTTATKLTVGTVPAEHADVSDLRRWLSEDTDIRHDATVAQEVLVFIKAVGVRSVAMTDRIIGCPLEEGIDYEGETCPRVDSGPGATAGRATGSTKKTFRSAFHYTNCAASHPRDACRYSLV